MRDKYVYDKDGKKYVCIGYLVEVPNNDVVAEEAADVVICPVCGCILSGVVHGNKKA